MLFKKILSNAAFILAFGFVRAFAQEAVLSSGGDASGKGGSISYSIGQMVYTTNKSTTGSMVPGVQQPFEISVIQGAEIDITCIAYPNPTVDILKLRIGNFQFYNLYYQLYDMLGRLIESKRILNKETLITTTPLAQAAYLLKITDNKKAFKTFKIVKNNKPF